MKTLYIVRGLPGSGKSTYAKSLGIPHFEADMYFSLDGEYKFRPWRLKQAHEWCIDQVIDTLLRTDSDVVVSNTFTTMRELTPYLEFRHVYAGLKIGVVEVKTQYESVHGVPEATMAKMKARWQDVPPEYYDELITIDKPSE